MSEANTFPSSREAYEFCVANNLISKRVAEVLKVLAGGPMNQTMAHQAIVRETGRVALEKYSVSPRFAVLERMGLIRDIGRQRCPVTGRSTTFFEATNTPPTCTEKQASDMAARRATMATLKAELAEVRKENENLREILNLRSASFHERERRLKETPVAVQTTIF